MLKYVPEYYFVFLFIRKVLLGRGQGDGGQLPASLPCRLAVPVAGWGLNAAVIPMQVVRPLVIPAMMW